ncbi:MAG TPA: prolyl oligopeptidase family serine peptidase [Rhizomicrobium sp.]|nr:prolyl oligopeptidase family serine peptidase [Rhizomicrobium sp.]
MRVNLFTLLLGSVLGFVLATGAFAVPQSSSAPDDPYAWLEEVHGEKQLAWVKEQNAKSLGLLKADPRYQKNYDSILEVLDATDRIAMGNLSHGFVYNFWQDAKNPKGVWRRTAIADYQNPAPRWELLLDIDALAKTEKENWVFKGAECAPTGKPYCLIKLSRGGGDAVVVREFDTDAKAFVKNGFHLPEAKSDASYVNDDSSILYASDFGPGSLTKSGYARMVKFWKRGEPEVNHTLYEGKVEDVLVSPTVLRSSPGEDVALVTRAISFFESEYYPVTLDASITSRLPLPLGADVKGALNGQLIATLRQDWTPQGGKPIPKGAIIAFPIDDWLSSDARAAQQPQRISVLYAPGQRQSVESVVTGKHAVYAVITDNVIGAVHVITADGKDWRDKVLNLPGQGSADIVSANDFGPEALFSFQNYLTPTTLYFDGGNDAPQPIKSLPARFDASHLITEQFEVASKDGTKIPYFVTRPKSLKGPAPTVLYGYGGFEVSLTPGYSANFGRLWLTHGGIYVVANIQGGGEFGPAWHDAALKTKRQHAYDDFEAVAADLARRGLTTPKQLGIMGGSNGGLLVSTVMVQKPELFGAVVCQVPLIDMIAYSHIGAGASWIGEYGDPAIPAERDYILTYSPYQNVKAGVTYPPVFFVTATSDDRVTPVHARKMAAKMTSQGHQVLFYENTDGGHAAAADHRQSAEMWSLSFVYLAQKLGLAP